MKANKGISIFKPEKLNKLRLPLLTALVKAGFPSPADDYIDKRLDLNELLIRHPSSTFLVRTSGDSMIDAGIHPGDILIIDRALAPSNNSVVIAVVDGDLTVKRIQKQNGRVFLTPENPNFPPLEITGEMELSIWGVVTYVIHRL